MPVDFTTYTEVEEIDDIQKTATHVDFIDRRNRTTYLYRDFGAGYFTDFIHWLDITRQSHEDSASGYFWMISNALKGEQIMRDDDDAYVAIVCGGSDPNTRILEHDSLGAFHQGVSKAMVLTTKYYIRIEKVGTSFYCDWFSTANLRAAGGRGDGDWHSDSMVLQADYSMRFQYIGQTHDDGRPEVGSSDMDNLILRARWGSADLAAKFEVVGTAELLGKFRARVAWLSGWDGCRLKITLDSSKVDAALSDFPVVIKLSSSMGSGADDVTAVFDALGANSLKIAFTENNGVTQLYGEIEKWDDGAEIAVIHVKVPTIASGTDTIIYMYYDAAHANNTTYIGAINTTPGAAVWDGDFEMVVHMEGAQDTDVDDSTSNNHDVTSDGGAPGYNADSQVGEGVDFVEATSDYLVIPDSAGFSGDGAVTVEVLVKPDALPAVNGNWDFMLCHYDTGGAGERSFLFAFYYQDTDVAEAQLRCNLSLNGTGYYGYGGYPDNGPLANGNYYHLVYTWTSGSLPELYCNGVKMLEAYSGGVPTGTIFDGATPFEIGTCTYDRANRYHDGIIDEIRWSVVNREAPWVKATYNSLFDLLVSNVDSECTAVEDLSAGFIVRHSDSEDLPGEFVVRHAFPAPPPWLPGWRKRVKLTIDQNDMTGALTDFPLLIHLSSASGINDDDVTFVFDEVGANSLKIAATTADGLTECYVEVEKWDNGGEEAWLWAKIPSIASAPDTEIYLYYDNSHADNTAYVGPIESTSGKAVWDSDFEVVAHFANDPSAGGFCMKGSTSNSIDGDPQGVWDAGDLVPALAGDGLEFNKLVWVLMNTSFNYYPCTVEIWLKSPNQDAGNRSNPMMACRNDGDEEAGNFHFSSDLGDFHRDYYAGPNTTWQGDTAYSKTYGSYPICDNNVFHHLVLAIESSNGNRKATFYVDGVIVDSFVSTDNLVIGGGDPLWVGHTFNETADMFEGILDEMRVSSANRNAAWVIATYESGRDDLLDFGSQEVRTDLYGKFSVKRLVTFIEDFEEGNLDKWDTVGGTAVTSDEQNHTPGGSLSLKTLSSDEHSYVSKNWAIQHSGQIMSVWFYDDATARTDKAAIFAVHDGVTGLLMGVYTDEEQDNYIKRIDGVWSDTGIARSTGWHRFAYDFRDGATVKAYIDGAEILDEDDPDTFNLMTLGNVWVASDAIGYWDDVNNEFENLAAEFSVRQETSVDLLAEFIVRQEDSAELLAEFVTRQSGSAEFLGKVEVQQPASAELLGNAVVRDVGAPVELLGKAEVQQSESAESLGKAIIRQSGSAELLGKFEAQATAELLGTAEIQRLGSAELLGKFDVGQGSAELLGKGIIRQSGSVELLGSVEVRQSGSAELLGKFEAQATVELLGNAVIRQTGSAELLDEVVIRQPDSADLLAYFEGQVSLNLQGEFIVRVEDVSDLLSDLFVQQLIALWSDGFETGDFTNWGPSFGTGIKEVIPAAAIKGTFGAHFRCRNVALVGYDLSSGHSKVMVYPTRRSYVACWFRLNAFHNVDSPLYAPLVAGLGTRRSDDIVRLEVIYKTANTFTFRIISTDGAGTTSSAESSVLNLGQDYWLNLYTQIEIDGTGEAKLFVDSVEEISLTNLNNDRQYPTGSQAGVTTLNIGIAQNGTSLIFNGVFDIYVDDGSYDDEYIYADIPRDEDLSADFVVRHPGSEALPGAFTVRQPDSAELLGEFEAQATAELLVHAEIQQLTSAELLCRVEIRAWGAPVLLGKVVIRHAGTPAELLGEFEAQATAELLGKVEVQQSGSAELLGSGIIRHSDTAELLGNAVIRQPGSAELLCNVEVQQSGSAELLGKFEVQAFQSGSAELLGKTEIQQSVSAELLGKALIGQSGSAELLGKGIIRQSTSAELLGKVEVQQSGSAELLGKFEAQVTAELLGNVDVRQSESAELLGKFEAQATVELLGRAEVQQLGSAELFGKAEIQQSGSAELLGKFDVGQGSAELLGEFIIRQGAENLYASFQVYQYYGNEFRATATTTRVLNAVGQEYAFRFTAQDSKTVKEIAVYHASVTGHTYKFKVGLQGNSSGDPDGVWINNCEVEWDQGGVPGNQGWNWNVLSNTVALTKGTIYHVVIEATEVTNTFNSRGPTPENRFIPWRLVTSGDIGAARQVYDAQLDARYYNGAAWSSESRSAVFVLKYTDNEIFGQPYDSTWPVTKIFGSTTQYQTITPGRTVTIKSIAVYVRKQGNPPDSLYISLRSGGTTHREVTITAAEVGPGYAWEGKSIDVFTLKKGVTYTLYWTSPGSNVSNFYEANRCWSDDTPPSDLHSVTWGGTASTYNSPAVWPGHDMTFRFRQTADRSWEDVPATFEVAQGSADLLGEFIVSQVTPAELPAEFAVRHETSADLLGRLIVRHEASGDLLGEFISKNVGSANLLGEFVTRQSGSAEFLGKILIRHVGTPVELPGGAIIRQSASAELLGNAEVKNIGTAELLGKAIIRHLGTPVELLGKAEVQQSASAELLGNAVIRQPSSAEFLGEFVVRQEASADLLGEFISKNVGSADLLGEFVTRQSGSAELPAEFVVRYDGSRDFLGGFVVRQEASADLLGEFISKNVGSADLLGELIVRQEASVDLYAAFESQVSVDLLGEFTVRQIATINLPSEFIVKHPATINLPGEFIARHPASLVLPAEFIVRHLATLDLLGEFIVRQITSEDLLGELIVRHSATLNLLGKLIARHEATLDLLGEFIVRQITSEDLLGELVVRHPSSQDLLGELITRHSATLDLLGEFIVRQVTSEDLLGELIVRQEASVDLYAAFESQASVDLLGEFIVRQIATINLPGKFIVKHSAELDLPAKFQVTHSENLLAKLWVRHPYRLWTNRHYINGIVELDETELNDALLEYVIQGVMDDIKSQLINEELLAYVYWTDITVTPKLIRRATAYGTVASLYSRDINNPNLRIVLGLRTIRIRAAEVRSAQERAMDYWESRMEKMMDLYLTSGNRRLMIVDTEDEEPVFSLEDIPFYSEDPYKIEVRSS